MTTRPPFLPDTMQNFYPGSRYESAPHTPDFLSRCFPEIVFYTRVFLLATRWLSKRAKKGLCDDISWAYGSGWILKEVERAGMRVYVEGLDVVDSLGGPCVFVANHMSTLETYLLPGILRPRLPVTFVVKHSLTTMAGFGPIMRSRNPVVVDRVNPRDDLKAILDQGCDRLSKGISIVVFPQGTRQRHFHAEHFNTIGVKLARKAGVPVVPLALKTDAWGTGKHIKELGPITPGHDILFRFFPPVTIQGSGHAEHKAIQETIAQTLKYWERRQDIIDAGGERLPIIDPRFALPQIPGR